MKLLLAALLIVPTAANAADCTLQSAIYRQTESKYELRFTPVPAEFAGGPFSNAFTLDGGGVHLTGDVRWSSGASRPVAAVGLDCPADPSPEEFEVCNLYEDVPYALTGERLHHLPPESEAPPDQILFPDLQGTLWYSKLRDIEGITDMPWDVFQFAACAG